MIYLFNKSKTPWVVENVKGIFNRLTSNRINKTTGKTEYIGIGCDINLTFDEELNNCVEMGPECRCICNQNTNISFGHKDLKPRISCIPSTVKCRNMDVFVATIPLNGGIIKNIAGANVLSYKIIANEFIVYFIAKHKIDVYETPVITIANVTEQSEVDYVFETNEDGNGYRVVENYYNSNPSEEVKPMKFVRYRIPTATRLIFVRESDMAAFNTTIGERYTKFIVESVTDENIDEVIANYTSKNFKAATVFVDSKAKNAISADDTILRKVTEKFLMVNVVLNTNYIIIFK